MVLARAGSQRFPGKNTAPYRGKPLVAWTLEAALNARSLAHLLVSTNDPAVALIARAWGVEVLDRPEELATDEAVSEHSLRHALAHHPAPWVVLLQPTSPHRSAVDIDACVNLAQATDQPVVSYRPDGSKNGAVYVASADWIATHTFAEPHRPYVMPPERSLDVDYPHDLLPRHCAA